MGEIHEFLRASLQKRRNLTAAEFKRAVYKVLRNRTSADKSGARGRIDALHRGEIILVERRERKGAGFKLSACNLVQLAAVFFKAPVLCGGGRFHLQLDEDVVAAVQTPQHLFDRRHCLRTVDKLALSYLGERQLLDDTLAVGGALEFRVVHYDEMPVLGHADIHLESGDARVQALRETAGGVVLVFAARTAVRENARTFNVVFDLSAARAQRFDDLLRERGSENAAASFVEVRSVINLAVVLFGERIEIQRLYAQLVADCLSDFIVDAKKSAAVVDLIADGGRGERKDDRRAG